MRRRRDASSATTTTRSSPSRPLLLLAALAALPCLLCASAADGFSFAPKATTTAARARARTGGPSPLAPRPGERSTAVATTFRMTKEDDDRIRDVEEATEEGEVESSSEEEEVAAAIATTEATADVSAGGGGRKDSGGTTGFSLILLPTLLLKFAVVLCVKFATDVVVFPLLWAYRLARLGKRKAVRGAKRLFGIKNGGGGGVGGKVNGDAGEAS